MILSYRFSLSVVMHEKGWLSVNRLDTLHKDTFGYSSQASIQTALRRMCREGLVSRRDGKGAQMRVVLWRLTAKAAGLLNAVLQAKKTNKPLGPNSSKSPIECNRINDGCNAPS